MSLRDVKWLRTTTDHEHDRPKSQEGPKHFCFVAGEAHRQDTATAHAMAATGTSRNSSSRRIRASTGLSGAKARIRCATPLIPGTVWLRGTAAGCPGAVGCHRSEGTRDRCHWVGLLEARRPCTGAIRGPARYSAGTEVSIRPRTRVHRRAFSPPS